MMDSRPPKRKRSWSVILSASTLLGLCLAQQPTTVSPRMPTPSPVPLSSQPPALRPTRTKAPLLVSVSSAKPSTLKPLSSPQQTLSAPTLPPTQPPSSAAVGNEGKNDQRIVIITVVITLLSLLFAGGYILYLVNKEDENQDGSSPQHILSENYDRDDQEDETCDELYYPVPVVVRKSLDVVPATPPHYTRSNSATAVPVGTFGRASSVAGSHDRRQTRASSFGSHDRPYRASHSHTNNNTNNNSTFSNSDHLQRQRSMNNDHTRSVRSDHQSSMDDDLDDDMDDDMHDDHDDIHSFGGDHSQPEMRQSVEGNEVRRMIMTMNHDGEDTERGAGNEHEITSMEFSPFAFNGFQMDVQDLE
jgi:hypothetical protein